MTSSTSLLSSAIRQQGSLLAKVNQSYGRLQFRGHIYLMPIIKRELSIQNSPFIVKPSISGVLGGGIDFCGHPGLAFEESLLPSKIGDNVEETTKRWYPSGGIQAHTNCSAHQTSRAGIWEVWRKMQTPGHHQPYLTMHLWNLLEFSYCLRLQTIRGEGRPRAQLL